MVIESARKAAAGLLKPKFRSVLLKSVGLTILLFIGAWIGMEMLFSAFLAPILGPWPWVSTAILWLMSAGLIVGAGFLLAPVTALVAGLFLDDVAEHVERAHYAADGQGTAMALGPSIWFALRFTFVVIAANLVALMLVLLPGINVAIFFLVNGYLLGREYFMFAAMRFRSEEDANALRKANSSAIFFAGLIISGVMAVPLLNLATPVFAAGLMVHLHKALDRRYPDPARPTPLENVV
ncbi:sulfate transporter family protein [Salaquimonas pukyongi]|uniref:sulfate transporter family protein n=1 Tax=Salaquimonas pukyongi TaxID=2712698 RepID=UPI00096BC151|nr:sulfate transporter family protein [Salaquimonas pukyongi]